jgi:hypothetical protein
MPSYSTISRKRVYSPAISDYDALLLLVYDSRATVQVASSELDDDEYDKKESQLFNKDTMMAEREHILSLIYYRWGWNMQSQSCPR